MLAGLLGLGSEPDLGRQLALESVAVARRSDDPMDLVRTILTLHFLLDQVDFEEKLDTLAEALAIAERQGEVHVTQLAASRTAHVHRALGDFDAMWPYHRMALGSGEAGVGILQTECLLAVLAGDLHLATSQLRTLHHAARRLDVVPLYSGSLLLLLNLWRAQPCARSSSPSPPVRRSCTSAARAFLAFSRLQEQQLDAVEVSLEDVRAVGFGSLPRGMTRVFSLALWGEVVAAVGDRTSARRSSTSSTRSPGTWPTAAAARGRPSTRCGPSSAVAG